MVEMGSSEKLKGVVDNVSPVENKEWLRIEWVGGMRVDGEMSLFFNKIIKRGNIFILYIAKTKHVSFNDIRMIQINFLK